MGKNTQYVILAWYINSPPTCGLWKLIRLHIILFYIVPVRWTTGFLFAYSLHFAVYICIRSKRRNRGERKSTSRECLIFIKYRCVPCERLSFCYTACHPEKHLPQMLIFLSGGTGTWSIILARLFLSGGLVVYKIILNVSLCR